MSLLAITFSDIFKKSFLENWNSQNITIGTVALCLIVTALIGTYIFFLYRSITRKTFYSKSFNISLVGVSLITAAIIITIQSNIVISLGMVGALSIVRFRTAIKNPMDLMFLFWAISVGIICGAGHSLYAVCLSVILTIVVLSLDWIPMVKNPMILVVNASDIDIESQIMPVVNQYCKHANVKARSLTKDSISLTIELSLADSQLVQQLQRINNVTSVALITHNGETTL
ncbi:MAG: DUF4956 domain-containing protein [Bacteroidales bacterium]|nr:DUF4956 domain-containing protein [Bacteroidales bacterium]